MISRLRGTIIEIYENKIEIETTSGITYIVRTPEETLLTLSTGDHIFLFTHLDIKETDWNLYGFTSIPEKELFLMLLSVSGVGPKSALAILNVAPLSMIVHSIKEKNSSIVVKASGIGKKSAEKIVIDLCDSVKKITLPEGGSNPSFALYDEFYEALLSLGFRDVEIKSIIELLPETAITIQEKITFALSKRKSA